MRWQKRLVGDIKAILVNYGVSFDAAIEAKLLQAQGVMTASAACGGIGQTIVWNRANLVSTPFYNENREIFHRSRGCGYWLWKPHIILEALRNAPSDVVVVYWDVGRPNPNIFTRSIEPLIQWCLSHNGMLPGVPIFPNGIWTKRDCFHLMDCDSPRYWNARQIQATFSLWSGKAAIDFVSEWLAWCTDRRCLTDDPNECGLPNLPGFKEHRHDQSILTNLCIKRGVQPLDSPFFPPGGNKKDINLWAAALEAEEAAKSKKQFHFAGGEIPTNLARVSNSVHDQPPSLDSQLLRAWKLQEAGNLREAEKLCRSILDRQPKQSRALHILGLIYLRTGRLSEGLEMMRKCVAISPNNADFQGNLAIALGTAEQYEESLAAFDAAIKQRPNNAMYYSNRGVTLEKMGMYAEAIESYRKALSLDGVENKPIVYTNLGNAAKKLGDAKQSEQAYRELLNIDPLWVMAWKSLSDVLNAQARHTEAIEAMRRAVSLRPDNAQFRSDLLYMMHYSPHVTREELFKEHRAWAAQHGAPFTRMAKPHDNDRTPDRKLRIGYLSPDLRRHSIGTFAEPLVSNHNHSAFEVICYSAVNKPDAVTSRIHAKVDGWRDISRLSDFDAIELIRKDKVDILVDLTCHTGKNRLPIFAGKPAPVQITYLGYPDTSGLSTIDYRLSDNYLDPPGQSEQYHTEQIVRLPQAVACYCPPDEAVEVGPLPAENAGHVTFGCLNNPAKVTAEAMRLWCQILKNVSGSRLLLRYDLESKVLQDVVSEEQIDPARIEWLRRSQAKTGYLDAFNRIDIALDPFPYNGHTTSCDGFWMGVPMIALEGDRYAARMGVSLLMNLGLADLIAKNSDEYVSVAVQLAQNLPQLSELRRTLRERFKASPIMDVARFMRNVEAIYRQVWTRWCSQEPVPANSLIVQ